nr:hypothetical protein [Sphingobacteriales bacterium]
MFSNSINDSRKLVMMAMHLYKAEKRGGKNKTIKNGSNKIHIVTVS